MSDLGIFEGIVAGYGEAAQSMVAWHLVAHEDHSSFWLPHDPRNERDMRQAKPNPVHPSLSQLPCGPCPLSRPVVAKTHYAPSASTKVAPPTDVISPTNKSCLPEGPVSPVQNMLLASPKALATKDIERTGICRDITDTGRLGCWIITTFFLP